MTRGRTKWLVLIALVVGVGAWAGLAAIEDGTSHASEDSDAASQVVGVADLAGKLRHLRAVAKRTRPEVNEEDEEDHEAHRDRSTWLRRMYEDDQGHVPPNALMAAKAKLDRMTPRSAGDKRAGITASSWTELGPSRVGGRVRALAVHSDNPDTVWLGGASGGLWKSLNKGQLWSPVSSFVTNLVISSMVIKPTDSNVMWIGTGESFDGSGAYGAGVFRSTDAGVTWTQLGNTTTWTYVNRLAVAPDGNTLLAAVEFAADDDNPNGTGRIYRSIDDGSNWLPAASGEGTYGDVDFDPSDSTRVVAGVSRSGGQFAAGPMIYSTTGGQTWTNSDRPYVTSLGNVSQRPIRVETAWTHDGTNTVFAYMASLHTVGGSSSDSTGGLYRSTDGGATWTAINRPSISPEGLAGDGRLSTGGLANYGTPLWISPTDPDLIFAGGVSLFSSINGGANFTRITDSFSSPEWGGESVHADHHIFVAHPNYATAKFPEVYMGNDGGVYMCQNPATAGRSAGYTPGFTRLNNNLRITQFYAGDIIGTPGREVFAGGTQDNGTLAFINDTVPGIVDFDQDWFSALPGDGGICQWDPQNTTYLYGSMQRGNFTRRDGGVPFHPSLAQNNSGNYNLDGEGERNPPHVITDSNADSPFIPTAMDLDPQDPHTLWIGLRSVWRTNDARTPLLNAGPNGGPTWSAVLTPQTSDGFATVVKVDPSNSSRVWAGFDGGQLYFTLNGRDANPIWASTGTAVNQAGGKGQLTWPIRRLSGIAIDPNDSNHVCVCFAGFTSGNVWVTEDGGTSWERMDAMPEVPSYDVEIHPFQRNSLYVGTELGVVASNDHGSSWTATVDGFDGPVATRVTELMWLEDTLYVATFGRGLFKQRITQPTNLYLRPDLVNRIPWPPIEVLEPIDILTPIAVGLPIDIGTPDTPFVPPVDLSAPPLVNTSSGKTWVWSNEPPVTARPDVEMASASNFRLRSKRAGTSALGRVYLVLAEKREAATNTPIWGITSALVPQNAKVTTLLGLAVQAIKDEMSVASNVNKFLRTVNDKSGDVPTLAPGGYSFADSASETK